LGRAPEERGEQPAGVEIERKFLVTEPPPLDALRTVRIDQGYLAVGDDEVRLRRKGERFSLCVKRGGGMIRSEEEIPLGREQFEALWPATEGRRVQKQRTAIPHGDRAIELDVYEGELDGLVIAEVEFEDAAQAIAFVPPRSFGREVTDDRRYKNQALAVLGLPEDALPQRAVAR
jgi:adenylate cyclase